MTSHEVEPLKTQIGVTSVCMVWDPGAAHLGVVAGVFHEPPAKLAISSEGSLQG